MKLELSSEQQMLRDTLGRAMQAHRNPMRLRQAETEGIDRVMWRSFCELDLLLLRARPEQGGSGLGLFDGVLVCETAAEALALIPATQTLAGARLLSDLGTEQAVAILTRIGEGSVVTLALGDVATAPQQIVAFAAVAEIILYRHGDRIYARQGLAASVSSLGGGATSAVQFDPGRDQLLGSGSAVMRCWQAAIEEWKLLNAASIAAMARQALLEASAYACQREAFGRPIGTYQGLSHPLADSLADVDGAALLVWRAVEAIARGAPGAAAMVSMSVWWAADRCSIAARRAMRVFGGYGMTMDYDAQIFFRRIVAQSLLAGDPEAELLRAARRLWLGDKIALPDAGDIEMTFEFDPAAQEVLETARRIFAVHVTPERMRWSFESGDGFDPELYAALAQERVLFPEWPEKHGGFGAGGGELGVALQSAFNEHDWNYTVVTVTDMIGKIVERFGTEVAKAEILPRFAAGEAVGALCYTEPSCGSDVFAVRTRARRDGDDWVIDGQKIFTSQGHIARYGLMLARTGNGPKHSSITLFALPLDLAGYRCEPIDTIGDETTNTTFYDGMRIRDAYRLGEVDGGVSVLAWALAMEQGGSAELYVGALKALLDNALEWARGSGAMDDPATLRRLARVATAREVTEVLSRRAVAASSAGKARKHYGPMAKLFGSEAWVTCSADLLALTAPTVLIQDDTPLGHIEKSFRRSIPGTIYAGTSEVQRSIIAEAGLGMPRTRG